MRSFYSASISTDYGAKGIHVYNCDILDFDIPIDILTVSASKNSYYPHPKSLLGSLHQIGISVEELSSQPLIDLRSMCNTWLSYAVDGHGPDSYLPENEALLFSRLQVTRIGCVEMEYHANDFYRMQLSEEAMLNSICSYFRMLDIAAIYGVRMETIALPLLGAGVQMIAPEMIVYPLLNECIDFLKRNQYVKQICFIDRNHSNNIALKTALQNIRDIPVKHNHLPVSAADSRYFISYATPDLAIAEQLCTILTNHGVQVWFAPRNSNGIYAEQITSAIRHTTHFVILLSEHSKKSANVLSELALAFNESYRGIKIKPVHIDNSAPNASFEYYLVAFHQARAIPPSNFNLISFASRILAE